jgi:Derlin-2/3
LLTDGCNFLLVNRGLQLEHEHIKVITLCYSCFWILDYLLSLFRYYNSLPPISKAYGTLCFFATVLCQLQILNPPFLALYYPFVFKKFQIWRLFTSFFFLGKFSINFGIRLLMIARYGVQLEKGAFEKRTADFLWMMIFGAISLLALSAIPFLDIYFLGVPMVSMLLYVWSREYPNSQISMYGLVQLRSFYLPWAMLGLDVIFGSEILPGLLGILVGHTYYFLSVLHPLATGKNYLKTPMWVHKIVARFRIGVQANAPVRPAAANTGSGAFRGRSYRLSQ